MAIDSAKHVQDVNNANGLNDESTAKASKAPARCNFCEATTGLEWHHIIPRSLGGTDDAFNLLLVCNVHHSILHGMKKRGNIRSLTLEGIARARAKGKVMGFAAHVDPASIVIAREKGAATNAAKADTFAAQLRPTMERMKRDGMSASAIAAELNATGIKTARGGNWAAQTVINMQARWVDAGSTGNVTPAPGLRGPAKKTGLVEEAVQRYLRRE